MKGETVGYFSKSLDIFGVLCGLTASEVLKPQSNRRPMTTIPADSVGGIVATESAVGRTPITVEGYSRNQPTGPRSNPVNKPVKVSAHTKVPGLRGKSPKTSPETENTEVKKPTVVKAGSILFQIGSEVLHVPLSNLKSVMCNEDGTLTFTVKP
jgi:hypothetical protein